VGSLPGRLTSPTRPLALVTRTMTSTVPWRPRDAGVPRVTLVEFVATAIHDCGAAEPAPRAHTSTATTGDDAYVAGCRAHATSRGDRELWNVVTPPKATLAEVKTREVTLGGWKSTA
jgi:hypothetical protein